MAVVTKLEYKILEYLDLGLNLSEIERVLRKSRTCIRFRLRQMEKRGLVEKIGGKWIVTRKGRDAQVCVLSEKEIRIIRLLCDQGMRMNEISQKLQMSYYTIQDTVYRLVDRGVIRRVQKGKYERIQNWDWDILLDPIPSEKEAI